MFTKYELKGYEYVCLSTDVKLTADVIDMSTLLETNVTTGEVLSYIFMNGAWRLDGESRVAEYTQTTLGGNGGIMLTDTTQVTGDFRYGLVIADATFTVLTTPDLTKNGTVTALAAADWGLLDAGTQIPARITVCKLESGKVILYK